ncbi:hypothetical protein DL768_011152 [Monosporascus sp. mg162]|nr:hypothetical protein DL768_011152 [Monosporascus sp. mg162]
MTGLADAKSQSRQWPQTAGHLSRSEQPQASGDPTLLNPGSRPETERPWPSSGSSSFNNSGPGLQFNAPGGEQNNYTGNGPHFPRATFHAPVYIGKNFSDVNINYELVDLRLAREQVVKNALGVCRSRMRKVGFSKDDFEDQRSVVSALCCILYQLFKQKRVLLSDAILDQFDIDGETFTSSFGELWHTLINAAKDENAGEIVCLLDAIDECEAQGRSQLDLALRKLYETRRSFNLKFLLTSRPYGEIYRDFQPIMVLGLPVIHLSGESDEEVEKISREIDIFIKARVQDIGAQLKLTHKQQDLLLRELMRVPNRTYLWVHLTLKLIEGDVKIDKTGIFQATSHLPQTVDEAYDRILSKSHDSEKAKKILHIVVAAARPLTLREMNLALALRESDRSYPDLDLRPENRFSQDVRDICGLFVTIIDSRIYLLHQTAKEFLVRNEKMNFSKYVHRSLKWKHALQPQESHRILAEICIWHLLLDEFGAPPLDGSWSLSQYVENHTFLDYSAKYWAAHVRELRIGIQNAMTHSILRICDTNSKRYLTWLRIYWTSTNTDFPQGLTTLMIASYFGLRTAVKHLLKIDDSNLNSQDDTYQRSALSWAAGNGFDGVVKLLIKGAGIGLKVPKPLFGKGADVDAKSNDGRTPLSYGVWNGNAAVAKLLIKAGAQVDARDEIGGTPLSYAVCNGRKEVIKLLLKKGSQVDSEDDIIKELLFSAAKKGHEEVVRLLLETGRVDPDAKDINGQMPLSWATEGGHEAVVELLLKAGANVNYEYTVVSKPAPSLVYSSVKSMANPGVSGWYSM